MKPATHVERKVLITVPLRALLDQFAPDFPGFCKVGTGHNKKIDFEAKGFIAVTDSVQLLKKLKFAAIFVDEAHHPLPPGLPTCEDLYLLSATQKKQPDFRYTMGKAIQEGVLCDYDITVPAVSKHHAYVCLADLLLKQLGRFRRVLAYCNSVAEAKRFRMVLKEVGLAAWHINSRTPFNKRETVIQEFAGALQKPVHVLVTVEVLGEGINIPNADTCMFVEPRNSYRSIVQAIGRVLRHHPSKTLSHVILPAVAIPNQKFHENAERPPQEMLQSDLEMNPNTSEEQYFGSSLTLSPATRARTKGRTERTESVRNHSDHLKPCRQIHAGSRGGLQMKKAHADIPFGNVQDSDEPKSPQSRQIFALHPENPGSHSLHKDFQLTSKNWDELRHVNQQRSSQESESGTQRPSGSSLPCTGLVAASKQLGPNTNFDCTAREVTADSFGVAATFNASLLLDQYARSNQYPRKSCQPHVVDPAGSHTDMPRRIRIKPAILGLQEDYDSQVERFLAMLVQADDRLAGTTASYRIEIADCSLQREGKMTFDTFFGDVYRRLSAILFQRDPWEIRFKSVEEFCTRNGRLPVKVARSLEEKSLGAWLGNQNARLKHHSLQPQRLNRLLNSSIILLRERVKGWLAGDRDGIFPQRCAELKLHLATHGALPLHNTRLGRWLQRQRRFGLNAARKSMLQNTHPIVKDLVKQWELTPLQIPLQQWQHRLRQVNHFTERHGRLPAQNSRLVQSNERHLYVWFHRQKVRVEFGILPQNLAQQFRSCHPLIVADVRQSEQKGRKSRFPTLLCVAGERHRRLVQSLHSSM